MSSSSSAAADQPREFDEVIKPVPRPMVDKKQEQQQRQEEDKEGNISTNQGYLSNSAIAETLRNSPTFNKFRTDVNDAQIAEIRKLAPLQEFTIDVDGTPKTFKKNKIKRRDYKELESLRARLAKTRDPQMQSELNDQILEKAAGYYLGMTVEEFDVADFEYVKRILDTCNIVTVHGIPNS